MDSLSIRPLCEKFIPLSCQSEDKDLPLSKRDDKPLYGEFSSNKRVVHQENLSTIEKEIDDLYQSFSRWQKDTKKDKKLLGDILFRLEFFKISQDNQINFSAYFFSETYQTVFVPYLKIGERAVSWVSPLIHIGYNVLTILKLNQYKKDLSLLETRLQNSLENEGREKIASQIFHIHTALSNYYRMITWQSKVEKISFEIMALILEKIFFFSLAQKLAKSCGYGVKNIRELYRLFNVSIIQREWLNRLQPPCSQSVNAKSQQPNEKLRKGVTQFLNSLQNCASLSKLNSQLILYGIPIEPPSTLALWNMCIQEKDFQKQLVQLYYNALGQQAIPPKDWFIKYGNEMQGEKIQHACDKIKELIKSIDKEKKSPLQQYICNRNKKEDSHKFSEIEIRQLATDWVLCQEKLAQTSLEIFQKALVAKIQIEQECLPLYAMEKIVGLASTALYLCLFFPATIIGAGSKAFLRMCLLDIGKISIGNICILPLFFPEMNVKIDNIFMSVVKKYYMVRMKPNQYSMEGYKTDFRLRMFPLSKYIRQISYLASDTALRIYIIVIDNGLLGQNIQCNEDDRIKNLQHYYENKRSDCVQKFESCKNKLIAFAIKDVQDRMTEYTEDQSFSTALVSCLQNADFDYFDPFVIRFFQENGGITLSNHNDSRSNVRNQLESLFCSSGDSFVRIYEESRFPDFPLLSK